MKNSFDPDKLNIRENYHLMISGITPRPIALVSTQDKNGRINLAPFSFYNGFGANPPIVGFSPAYSGRTGLPKDTLQNIRETKEFTISAVDSDMAEQMSLTSGEYPKGVDEFIKSGFHKYKSTNVQPPGVLESKFIMECTLWDFIDLGGEPGSGNLILGKIVWFHINNEVFDDHGRIDPYRMKPIGRLGWSWYNQVSEGLFEINKPNTTGIGFDKLPGYILNSTILTGNDLACLAGVSEIPIRDKSINIKEYNSGNKELHELCQAAIRQGDIAYAWQIVLIIGESHG